MADADRGERGDERAPFLRGRRGEALAQTAVARVDAQLPPRLGIDEAQLADVGELLLARIADLDREHRVAPRQPQERRAPVGRAAEVRDDDDQRALPSDAVGELERVAQLAGPARGQLAQQVQRVEQGAPSLAGPLDRLLRSERDRAEPVAAPRRRVADGDGDALRDIRLASLAGAERHRRRRVEDEPRDEDALGELDANVRLAGACGHVPLDPAHVVSGLVRPNLPELAADSGERRAVVAREQAVDPAADRQLERAQRRRRQRPGPGRRRRPARCERVGDGGAHATARVRPRSICGAGTAARTESRIVSDATSSASAR